MTLLIIPGSLPGTFTLGFKVGNRGVARDPQFAASMPKPEVEWLWRNSLREYENPNLRKFNEFKRKAI